MNVLQCLKHAQVLGLPRLEAQILLLHALSRPLHDRAWLLAHDTDEVTHAQVAALTAFVQRRLQQEPVAYIVGQKEFFGLTLHIDQRVLDPRDDTEILVEWALACSTAFDRPRLLDLGTGSGAIALALKSQLTAAEVTAVDASLDALSVATLNAKQLSLAVTFLQSNWLAQVAGQFEVIVSNPPYVLDAEKVEMKPHVLDHEPHLALFVPDEDPLLYYRVIGEMASCRLAPGGYLCFEINRAFGEANVRLAEDQGFENIQLLKDFHGNDRMLIAQRPLH